MSWEVEELNEWGLNSFSFEEGTEHQVEQILKATSKRVGCFTGGPGTGKTFTMAQLAKALPVGKVAYAAPTGKAAVRMNEALEKTGAFGSPMTIHRLLSPTRNGHDGDGWSFFHNHENPIEYKYLIVDEASMISTDLMADLLVACKKGTRILFIGDPEQLLPVGHGKPFLDMINGGVAHGHLEEIHRFAGRIAAVCKAISHEEPWEPSEKIDLNADFPENFRFKHYAREYDAMIAFKAIYNKTVEMGYDPFTEIQVLCARNDKGTFSRNSLNNMLRKRLNPDGFIPDDEKAKFRVGDKAICLKNQDAEVAWEGKKRPSFNPRVYVANGETGIVVTSAVSHVDIEFDHATLRFHKGLWKDLDLAYAITGHKSQGSQWPVVIIPVDSSGGRVCGRNWWYTTISRASEMTIVIGSKPDMLAQCMNVGNANRKTFLAEMIKNGVKNATDAPADNVPV